MSTSFYKAASGLLVAALLVLCALLYVCREQRKALWRSPIVETQLFNRSGVEFAPGEKKYDVTVWKRVKLSTGAFDAHDIRQVRLEVMEGYTTHKFEWPPDASCAPESTELLDLGGTGRQVFVLDCWGSFRVVQFADGQFVFRPRVDGVNARQSRLIDLDNDRRFEYIASVSYPQKFGEPKHEKTLPLPVIYRWSPEKGFAEVSSEFPDYYRKVLIPELRGLQAEAEDAARKPLFDSAIEYIEQRLASNPPRNMDPRR